jgi:aminopeptidase YwaD
MSINPSIFDSIPSLNSEAINKHLTKLTEMGPRWPSGPAEEFAAKYIEERMSDFVDEMTSEPFEYPLYIPLEAKIEVMSRSNTHCVATGVQYSANGACNGELVYIEDVEEKDLKMPCGFLENKILLTNTRRPYVVALKAEESKMQAVVVISESPPNTIRGMIAKTGYTQGTCPDEFRSALPILAVDSYSGEQLRLLASKEKTEISLIHKSLQLLKKSRNIIGKRFGKTRKTVVMGAHYDTQINVPGAWDNAAGCAVLLDALRAVHPVILEHSMEFVAFGCEEIGISGSTHYVTSRKHSISDIIAYLNLDSVSSRSSTTFEVHTTSGAERFAAEALNLCRLRPAFYNLFGPRNLAQDSAPFFSNGVPALWVHEEGNPFFHTPMDTLEKIDIDRLTQVGEAIHKMAGYLAMGGDL